MELEDIHFHFDSAVLLPEPKQNPQESEPKGSSLDVIRQCYLYAKKNRTQTLLIAGHTDTSGDAGYNAGLSELRAQNALHLLLGNKDEWATIAHKKHRVEDYQQILEWMCSIFLWDCSPGEIDNVDGPLTKGALKRFQIRYNADYGGSLDENGKISLSTWKAFFDFYILRLKAILHTDNAGLGKYRLMLRFSPDGPPSVGCGEYHPKSSQADNRKSEIDRRVELLFIEEGDQPALDCHPDAKKCSKKKCILFDQSFYDLEPIPDSDISETFDGILAVRLLFYEESLQGIVVRFFSGGSLLGEAVTDTFGIASLQACFEIDYYTCRIEGQPDIRIPTVASADDPFEIVLPYEHPDIDAASQ